MKRFYYTKCAKLPRLVNNQKPKRVDNSYVFIFFVSVLLIILLLTAFINKKIKNLTPFEHILIVYSDKEISSDIQKSLQDNKIFLSYKDEYTKDYTLSYNTDNSSCKEVQSVYLALITSFTNKSIPKTIIIPRNFEQIVSSLNSFNAVIEYVDTEEEVFDRLKKNNNLYGVVSFGNISPQFKVEKFENKNIFFDEDYDLKINLFVCGVDLSIFNNISVISNRKLNNVLTFTQTGVTAISRGLAKKIEKVGVYDYPALKIADKLKKSDITHTSNEVSFKDDCIPSDGMSFCSNTKYFKTLLTADIDIVELTGNHNNDYGRDADAYTIGLYDEAGIKYFGGGKNIEDAKKILYIEQKGTKFALLGYNFYDAYYGNNSALASENGAGANPYSDEQLKLDIEEAKANADIVIVDFQFQECYCYNDAGSDYCYYPISEPDQEKYFKHAIDLGANIVVGTQAHMPQIIENYKNGVIFYGLGNLWFDQINWEWTRQGMILTHIFYEGKYLYTEVDPTYYNTDMQVYIAEGKQRENLLDIYYQRK